MSEGIRVIYFFFEVAELVVLTGGQVSLNRSGILTRLGRSIFFVKNKRKKTPAL
jgi:hypothetical protein